MTEFSYKAINIQTSNFKTIKIFWEEANEDSCSKIKGFEFLVVDRDENYKYGGEEEEERFLVNVTIDDIYYKKQYKVETITLENPED